MLTEAQVLFFQKQVEQNPSRWDSLSIILLAFLLFFININVTN